MRRASRSQLSVAHVGVTLDVHMDQSDKRIARSLDNVPGSSLEEARAGWRSLHEGEWRLRSIGYNLVVALVISMMIAVGIFFEVLDALGHPRRSLDALGHGQPLNRHPLESMRQYMDIADMSCMDVSDEDIS